MELRNKKQNNIYKKLVGCFTKKGKKSIAKTIISNAVILASQTLEVKSIDILREFVNALGIAIDLRTVRIRKNVYTVPIPVNSNRRNYLIVKKVSKVLDENKSRQSLDQKLSQELLNIVKKKNSKSLLQRDTVLKDAVRNKSNLHYRW